MLTKIIAKFLKKPLYKSNIIFVNEDFTGTHFSNCILDSIKWVLHGLHESKYYNKTDFITNGVYGQICEFKLLSISKRSIGILGYTKPKPQDMMFIHDNNMVYIPETILKKAKTGNIKLDTLIK